MLGLILAVGRAGKRPRKATTGPSTPSRRRLAHDAMGLMGSCDPRSQRRDLGHPLVSMDESGEKNHMSPFDSFAEGELAQGRLSTASSLGETALRMAMPHMREHMGLPSGRPAREAFLGGLPGGILGRGSEEPSSESYSLSLAGRLGKPLLITS